MWKISTYIAPCITRSHGESLLLSFTMEHDWCNMNHTYMSILSNILQVVQLYPCMCHWPLWNSIYITNFPRQRLLPTDRQSHQYSSPGVQIFKTTGIWDLTVLSKNLIYRFHSDNFPRSRIFETQLEILVNGLTLTWNRHFVLFLLETHLGYVEVLSRFHLPHKAPWECWVAIGFFLLRLF